MDLVIEHTTMSFALVSTVFVYVKCFKPFYGEKSRPEPRRGTMINHGLGALPFRRPTLFNGVESSSSLKSSTAHLRLLQRVELAILGFT